MAAALVTLAPRLRSSALSSSARRAEVTATLNPVSGAQSGSLMTPVYAVRVSGRLTGHCPGISLPGIGREIRLTWAAVAQVRSAVSPPGGRARL